MKIALAYALNKNQATISTLAVDPFALVAVTELLSKRYPANSVVQKFHHDVFGFIEDSESDEAYIVWLSYSDMRKMLPELFQIGNSIAEKALTLLDGDSDRHKILPIIEAYHSFMTVVTLTMRNNVKTSCIMLTEVY